MSKVRCRLCQIELEAGEDARQLLKYRNLIREEDRVGEEVYEERLAFCENCDRLVGVTCQECGCYVQIRAFAKAGTCPGKKWRR